MYWKSVFFYPGLFPCPSSLSLKYSKEQYSEKNRWIITETFLLWSLQESWLRLFSAIGMWWLVWPGPSPTSEETVTSCQAPEMPLSCCGTGAEDTTSLETTLTTVSGWPLCVCVVVCVCVFSPEVHSITISPPGDYPAPRAVLTGHDHEVVCVSVCAELGLVISGAKGLCAFHLHSLGDRPNHPFLKSLFFSCWRNSTLGTNSSSVKHCKHLAQDETH